MPTLFDDLRDCLLRAGIAPRHVRRYLAELNDHLADLRAATDSDAQALARLGSVDELAKPMLTRPELRSWIARAPWAAMVLGPIATMAAAAVVLFLPFVAIVLSGIAFGWPRGFAAPGQGNIEPMSFQIAVHAATALLMFVIPVVIGWAAGMLAITQRLPPLWPLVGLVVLALVGGTFDVGVTFPKVPGELSELQFGFGWATFGRLGATHFIANLALILGPYVYALRRSRIVTA